MPPTTNLRALRNATTAICALFAVFLLPPSLAAQPQNLSTAIDLHSYESELQQLSAQVEQNRSEPAKIARIKDSLPIEWTVEVNGTEFHVSSASLRAALSELAARPSNASALTSGIEFRLKEMRDSAIEMESTSSGPSRSTARNDLHAIFATRDFRGLKGPTQWQLMEERIGAWLSNLIARFLSRLHISAKTGNVVAWMVIAIAFLAICYSVYRTLSGRDAAKEAVAPVPDMPIDSREWVSDALSAGERGDYREAIHCAYWAAISRLEELKLLRGDRSRTPRESLGLLDSHPDEQLSLRNLTSHFELIWYGYRPASQADWSKAKSLLEKFGCLAASTVPIANS